MRLLYHFLLLSRPQGRNALSIRSPVSCFLSSGNFLDKERKMLCQLNHAGASPSSQSVIERVFEHMELEKEIGGYAAAQAVSKEVTEIYSKVANLINAKENEIALVESATVAWTRAFYAMAEKQLKAQKGNANIILVSEAEYAANLVAASQWARDKNWTLLAIPSSVSSEGRSSGMVDLQKLDEILSGNYVYKDREHSITLDPSRIALICITHIPTNSGIVNPVEEIGIQISSYNKRCDSKPPILYLVDACQSVGQIRINVETIQCHALVATGRKYLRAPRGSGFLFLSSKTVSDLWPHHIDHYGVPVLEVPRDYEENSTVDSLIKYRPRSGASKFEFWESNVAARLGLGLAIQESIEKGQTHIEQECTRLSKILREQLAQLPTVIVHHRATSSCGIVTFYSTTLDSKRIREEMQLKGFELSVVPATSTPLDSAKTKVPDLVRASLSYSNTPKEIKRFVQSLKSLLES